MTRQTTRSTSKASAPSPAGLLDPFRTTGLGGLGHGEELDREVVRATMNALFAAGLDLCLARSMITDGQDDEVALRIEAAITALDEVIVELRTRSAVSGFESLASRGAKTPDAAEHRE